MNTGNRKKLIILGIIIVIVIIIIISLSILLNSEKQKLPNIVANETNTQQENIKEEEEEEKIDVSKYYAVTNLVRQYYGALDKEKYILSDGTNYAEEEGVKESIYSLLSTEYIEKNNVEIDNIYEKVSDINETITFVPLKMQCSEGIGVDKFLVYGSLIYMNSQNLENIFIYVNIDYINQTFSIEPINEKYNDIEEIKLDNTIDSIEKNNFNSFSEKQMTEEEISKEKFNDFKLLILRKSEDLYNSLNEEYRNKKFGSYEEYEKYIDNNYDRLSTISITKYQVNEYNDYTQYVCLDKENGYYFFRDFNNGESEIILDTYTIDLPEFLEKYNKAEDEQKVGYNIEKFVSAINEEDYKYAYNVLDESFKQKNMPSQADFEKFVKDNFYANNTVEHNDVEKQGNLFVYTITLKNANNESEQKELTVIMKLEEETDFVMSFSIN